MHEYLKILCENDQCPLWPEHTFLPCEVHREEPDEPVDVLFVGDAARYAEARQKIPFLGEHGSLLRKLITYAQNLCGVRQLRYAMSNVVRCYPVVGTGEDAHGAGAREVIGQANVEFCKQFLIRDIQRLQPKIIVLLGRSAVDGLIPTTAGSIEEIRGRFVPATIGCVRLQCFPTFHPSFVLKNPGLLSIFRNDVMRAVQFGAGLLSRQRDWSRRGDYRLLQTVEEVEDYCYRELGQETPENEFVAVDVETENTNKRYGNRMGMLQFANGPDVGVCIPYQHPQSPFTAPDLKRIDEVLRWLFLTKEPRFRAWIAHEAKFEQEQIGTMILRGKRIRAKPIFDTLSGAYLLDENRTALKRGAFGLKALAKEWLRYDHYRQEDLDARQQDGGLMRLPLEQLADYGAMDAYVTWRLLRYEVQQARAQNYLNEWMLLQEFFYSPVQRFLSRMESNGIYIDRQTLQMLMRHDSPLNARLAELEKEFRQNPNVIKANGLALQFALGKRTTGKRGNTGRMTFTPQFRQSWAITPTKNIHLLFMDVLKLESQDKNEDGLPSIDTKFLDEHKDVPEAALVFEMRQLQKLKSTYLSSMNEYTDPAFRRIDTCTDSRLRPSYHLCRTTTGRSAAEAPNPQNIPTRKGAYAKKIKSLIRVPKARNPEDQECLIQGDARGAEVRCWAILSSDPVLSKLFTEGAAIRQEFIRDPTPENLKRAKNSGDPHKLTGSFAFSVPIDQVTPEQRDQSKPIVLGAMYGRSIKAIGRQLGKEEEEATEIYNRVMGGYAGGNQWLEQQARLARDQMFVQAPNGRRRRLDAFLLSDDRLQAEAERQAKNCLVGTTLIPTDLGFVPIGSAVVGAVAATPRGAGAITGAVCSGVRQTYALTLCDGRQIVGTADHPVLVLTPEFRFVWRGIRKIQPGDLVLCQLADTLPWPKVLRLNPPKFASRHPEGGRWKDEATLPAEMTEDLAAILGAIEAEGCVVSYDQHGHHSVYFTNKDARFLRWFSRKWRKVFGTALAKKKNTDGVTILNYYSKHLVEFFSWLGMPVCKARDKRVPWSILQAPKKCVSAFLRAYYEGDGSSGPKSECLHSSSIGLLRDVQLLLGRFGILANVYSAYRKKRIYQTKSGAVRTFPAGMQHNLHMHGAARDLFWKEIGALSVGARVRDRYSKRPGSYTQRAYALPGIRAALRAETSPLEVSSLCLRLHSGERVLRPHIPVENSKSIAEPVLRRICAVAPKLGGVLHAIRQHGLFAVPAAAVTKAAVEPVYDIEVATKGCFTAAGIAVHNSPIQAISSDFSLVAGALFSDWVEEKNKPWYVENAVHDSCITRAPVRDIPEVIRVHNLIYTTVVQRYFEQHWGMTFSCPLEMEYEVSMGPDHGWGSLFKLDGGAPNLELAMKLARCRTEAERDALLPPKEKK